MIPDFDEDEETTGVIDLRSETIRQTVVSAADQRVEELCRRYLDES